MATTGVSFRILESPRYKSFFFSLRPAIVNVCMPRGRRPVNAHNTWRCQARMINWQICADFRFLLAQLYLEALHTPNAGQREIPLNMLYNLSTYKVDKHVERESISIPCHLFYTDDVNREVWSELTKSIYPVLSGLYVGS